MGCGRTLAEIGNWSRYDDATRQAVMASLPARLAATGMRRAMPEGPQPSPRLTAG